MLSLSSSFSQAHPASRLALLNNLLAPSLLTLSLNCCLADLLSPFQDPSGPSTTSGGSMALSDCCNAPCSVAGRTTHYYACIACNKPCDTIPTRQEGYEG